MTLTDPDELVALGAFTGAQLLVVCFSVIIANAYRERALLFHGAAGTAGVLAMQMQVGNRPVLAQAVLLFVLALAGLHLRDLVNHAGALRQPRRWLVGVTAALPLLAILCLVTEWPVLPLALAVWAAVVAVVMLRAWPQSQPWAIWLVGGLVTLVACVAWAAWQPAFAGFDNSVVMGALLATWSSMVYLSSVWRSRIYSETKVRLDARTTVDPLTGLSMPMVLYERVLAARSLMKRYGHPSVLLLVHIDNLGSLGEEFGPEAGESALLVAASRIRAALGDGDIAARISHSRIAVLAEGASMAECTANLASRILVAGLKEPIPSAPTEFLKFRIVLAAVPATDLAPKALLQRLSSRMDEQLFEPSERHIHTLTADELLA